MITSQRELKRAIYSTAKEMKDADLFLSESYNEFLTQMQHGITSSGNLGTATLLPQKQGRIAFTTGKDTYIFYDSVLTSQKTRTERHKIFCGLNLHECGHILFTDFALAKKIQEKMLKGEIYPAPIPNPYLKEVGEYLNKGYASSIITLYHKLDNCIEDGFVDRAVTKLAPGYADCLRYTNKVDRVIEFATYEKMKAANISPSELFANMVLFYARHGLLAYNESTPRDEVIISFEDIRETIVNAVFEADPILRKRKTFVVFCYLFHFIASQNSNSQPDSEDQSNGQSDDSSQSQGNDTSADRGMDIESLREILNELGNKMPDSEKNEHSDATVPDKSALNELANIASGDIENPSLPPQESEQTAPFGEEQLETIAEKVAESIISQQQEAEIKSKMNCDVKTFLDGVKIHKNVTSSTLRQPITETSQKLYNELHGELDSIVRRLIAEFEKEMKDRQLGDTMYGLYSGKRFSSRESYRLDKKIFNRKILPENVPDMAVGIMVDLSGSMHGTRILEAIKTVYITYTFCRKLNIPVFVVGHSTQNESVKLVSVVDENSIDNKDQYRIYGMDTYSCNRDGFALRYCLKKLENIQAEDRLMLVISDGKPNHYGYGESEGKADCQDAVAEALKKGIITVTAGIGDAESVKNIYKVSVHGKNLSDRCSASYLDLSDLKKLPKSFVKIIKDKLS